MTPASDEIPMKSSKPDSSKQAEAQPTWRSDQILVQYLALDSNAAYNALRYDQWFANLDEAQPLPAQQANTARIFICANESLAGKVFRSLHVDEMEKRLQTMSYSDDDVPYSLPDLAAFTRLGARQCSSFGLSEMVTRNAEQRVYWSVQHRLFIRESLEHMYDVIWYTLVDERVLNNTIFTNLNTDLAYQKSFVERLRRGSAVLPTMDGFPTWLLLNVLEIDLKQYQEFLRKWIRVVNVENLLGSNREAHKCGIYVEPSRLKDETAEKAVERTVQDFKLLKRMIERAEDLVDCVNKEHFEQTMHVGPEEVREQCQKTLDDMRTKASHIVKWTRRIEKRDAEVSALRMNVAQMKQSASVHALTVVTCFFLPLTLAATMLSMQSTFQDIYERVGIGDMCSLAILLAISLALPLFVASRNKHNFDKLQVSWSSLYSRFCTPLQKALALCLFIPVGFAAFCAGDLVVLCGNPILGALIMAGSMSFLLLSPFIPWALIRGCQVFGYLGRIVFQPLKSLFRARTNVNRKVEESV